MSRTQVIVGVARITVVSAGTKYPLEASTLFTKSFIVQARPGNSGVITVFDQNGNPILELEPGLSATWLGDEMDNGGASQADMATITVTSTANGDQVNLSYSSGL